MNNPFKFSYIESIRFKFFGQFIGIHKYIDISYINYLGTRHLVPCLNSYEENIFLWPQSFTLNILKTKPSFDDNRILVYIRLRIQIVNLNCNILYPQGEIFSIICSFLYMPKLSCDSGNETYLASSNLKTLPVKYDCERKILKTRHLVSNE